jgi:serine/threonine protein kinase
MDRNRIINKLAKSEIHADRQRTAYQVGKELGRGGNGVAFVVKSPSKELVAKFYIPPDGRDLDDSALKRFHREMELTAQTNHPYVLSSTGSGNAQIGAYQIPFYLMPRATKTLRNLVPRTFYLGNLREMRSFTRVMQGVCYLHHRGIIHRDLKPENILIFKDTPKISDLGIAHITPEFANRSLLTLPKDQLMNRDYYAPEQRYGDATKVDCRADIYALGCMLYELVSGTSPTRPNMPRLEELDKRLAPLDLLFNKMTAHDPRKRYQQLDEAMDDLVWALIQIGDFGAPATTTHEDDKSLFLKLLNSANGLHQKQAIEPALRLGDSAVPLLHEALGSRRLDVVHGAYAILGELARESSIPFLVSGLYPRHTSSKPKFPTGEAAAMAIQRYEPAVRLKVLDSIKELVRAEDIEIIVEGLGSADVYDRLLRLYQTKRFFTDWGIDQGISILLKIDSDKAWPLVEEMMARRRDFSLFSVEKTIYPYVNTERRQRLIDHFLGQRSSLSAWELRPITDLIINGELPEQYVSNTLERLGFVASSVIKRYKERIEFTKFLGAAKRSWRSEQASAVAFVPESQDKSDPGVQLVLSSTPQQTP